MQLNIGIYLSQFIFSNHYNYINTHQANNINAWLVIIYSAISKHYHHYKHVYNSLFLLFVAVCLVCVPFDLFADDMVGKAEPPPILNNVNIVFTEACAKWANALRSLAKNLFFSLLVISATWRFGNLILSGNNDLQAVVVEMIKFLVTFGFFYWLIDQNSTIVGYLQDSFNQLADNVIASGGIHTTFKFDSPDGIILTAFETGFRVIKLLSWGIGSFGSSIIICILMLILIAIMIVIAIKVLLITISVNFLIYAGIVSLGFFGHETTKEWALKYYKTLIAKFVELFAIKLVVIAGMVTIYQTAAQFESVKSPGIGDACILLMVGFILHILSDQLPNMISGLIEGGGSSTLGANTMSKAGAGAMATVGAGAAVGVGAKAAFDTMMQRLTKPKDQEEGGAGGGAGTGAGGGAQEGGSSLNTKSLKDTGGGEAGSSEAGGASSNSSNNNSAVDMASIITGGAVSSAKTTSMASKIGKMLGGDGQLLTAGAKALGSNIAGGLDALLGKQGINAPISAKDGIAKGIGALSSSAMKTAGFVAKAVSHVVTGDKSSSFGLAEGVGKVASKVSNSKFAKDFAAGYKESATRTDNKFLNSPLHNANN